jgi:hypothetical protein
VVNAAEPSTRRRLLSSAAAGAAALWTVSLAGCGSAARARRRTPQITAPAPPPATPEVAALNAALAAEQQAIAFYTAVTPLLSGSAQRAASRFLAQDLEHAGELRALVALAGGIAHNPPANPQLGLGSAPGRDAILASLRDLEQAQIDAYLRAIPVVKAGYRRQSVAAMLANDAQHVAILRAEAGQPVLAGAFLTP